MFALQMEINGEKRQKVFIIHAQDPICLPGPAISRVTLYFAYLTRGEGLPQYKMKAK